MTDPDSGKSGEYFSVGRTTFCHPYQDATDSGTGYTAFPRDNLMLSST
jgi:hypothetical protein